jgi:hypothetical protein
MKIHEIRNIAKIWGVDAKSGRSKQDIIRDIQICEGYSACFGTKKSANTNACGKSIA